jgi:DNA-binding beta-propeller fold protein YncE
VISRRALLAVPFAAACTTRGRPGFRGYAFIANEDGQAVAAVDLQAMAVAKHIPLDGSPSEVLAARTRPTVYALTPASGAIHEIQLDRLSFTRKLTVSSAAASMHLAREEGDMYILSREPKSLVRVSLDTFHVTARIPLPEDPVEFALTPDGKTAAVTLTSGVRLIDLSARRLSAPLAQGDFGAVRFIDDGRTLIAANRGERMLALYDVASARLIANLPVAVRPDHLCFNLGSEGQTDGGQLFITGEDRDVVVIVFPYHTPEVFETVLAGHGLGAMAASDSFLFIASPQSGNVSILDITARKMIAVVSVGTDPGFVAVTPDDQYALVLNRKSGDVAVLRIGTIQPNRNKSAALLTVIPVGSRPVSAAVRRV